MVFMYFCPISPNCQGPLPSIASDSPDPEHHGISQYFGTRLASALVLHLRWQSAGPEHALLAGLHEPDILGVKSKLCNIMQPGMQKGKANYRLIVIVL